jgi:uncharacterized protein involved in high-affinity Fe2+ transport
MKKSLVLAMAIAMGISASAFAANPFSDVPAGHWAYASIAKLAAAGVSLMVMVMAPIVATV